MNKNMEVGWKQDRSWKQCGNNMEMMEVGSTMALAWKWNGNFVEVGNSMENVW